MSVSLINTCVASYSKVFSKENQKKQLQDFIDSSLEIQEVKTELKELKKRWEELKAAHEKLREKAEQIYVPFSFVYDKAISIGSNYGNGACYDDIYINTDYTSGYDLRRKLILKNITSNGLDIDELVKEFS